MRIEPMVRVARRSRAAAYVLAVAVFGAAGARAADPPRTPQPHFDFANGTGTVAGVGDANLDGMPDLVLMVAAGPAVRLGKGAGDFEPLLVSSIGFGNAPYGAVCDLNLDGRIDVVGADGPNAGGGFPYAIWSALGDGHGHFTLSSAHVGPGSPVGPPLVFDLDADGLPDVLIPTQFGYSVSKGAGDGQLAAPVNVSGFTSNSNAVAGDLDADGDVDVVLHSNVSGSNFLALMQNDGNLTLSTGYSTTWNATSDVAIGDVNGDGLNDIATSIPSPPKFEVILAGPGGAIAAFAGFPSVPVSHLAYAVELVDLDGDGFDDLVGDAYAGAAGLPETQVWTARSDGAGAFLPAMGHPAPGFRTHSSADLDGDGFADILGEATNKKSFAAAQADAIVLPGNGDGTLGAPSVAASMPWLVRLAAADLTGDGAEDVLALESTGQQHVVLHRNSGTGALLSGLTASAPGLPLLIERALGDVDNDGDLDVLVSTNTSSPQSAVFLNDGSGNLTWQSNVVGGGSEVLLADLDNDGNVDAIAAADGSTAATQGVFVSYGLGTGAFSPGGNPASGQAVDTLTAADVDHDGDLDVVGAAGGAAVIRTLFNAGGALTSTAVVTSGGAITRIIAADANGDAYPDLLALSGGVRVFVGDGAGGFTAGALAPGLDQGVELAARDADGDGLLDVCGAEALDFVEWLELDAQGDLVLQARGGAPAGTTSVTFGDLDGDGFAEILTGSGALGWLGCLAPPPPKTWSQVPGGVWGTAGVPTIRGTGTLQPGTLVTVSIAHAAPLAFTALVLGASTLNAPYFGGLLVPAPSIVLQGLVTQANGEIALQAVWPPGVPAGARIYMQAWLVDAGAPQGFAATPGLVARAP